MKIRTRLFIIFSALFAVVFLATFYVEEYFTRTSLVESEDYLRHEIVKEMERRREGLIKYVGELLKMPQGRVDALVKRVKEGDVIQKETPQLSLATLMLTNQWIDLAQYGSTTIVFGENRFHQATTHVVDDSLAIVWIDGEKYIGIPLFEGYTALFSQEYVESFTAMPVRDVSVKLLEPYLEWVVVPDRKPFIESVIEKVQKAQGRLSGLADISQPDFTQKDVALDEEEVFAERYDLSGMAWGLANMIASEALSPVGDGPR